MRTSGEAFTDVIVIAGLQKKRAPAPGWWRRGPFPSFPSRSSENLEADLALKGDRAAFVDDVGLAVGAEGGEGQRRAHTHRNGPLVEQVLAQDGKLPAVSRLA